MAQGGAIMDRCGSFGLEEEYVDLLDAEQRGLAGCYSRRPGTPSVSEPKGTVREGKGIGSRHCLVPREDSVPASRTHEYSWRP